RVRRERRDDAAGELAPRPPSRAAGLARSPEDRAQDRRRQAAAPARRHPHQTRDRGADFGSARRPGGDHPRPEALPVPRHRRHRLPCARSRRDRISVRAGDPLRRSGDERRDHGGAGRGAHALPRADRRADRALSPRAGRVRHRLPAAGHEPAARAGAAGLPLDTVAGAMTFLSPLFLAGAALAAVPIVLHLLKREPEARVKFAAVHLLKQAPVEHTEKRHLRELLLLALRVAALLLLALAFARPFFASGAALGSSGLTVVALDTSYSVSAPGRFDRAKQLAKDAIARAPAGDRVGVVTFADEAEIVAKPSVDRVLASAAIDEAAPGFGATRYRAALSAASQNLDGRRGTIVVVTDLQENGWDAGDHASVPEGTTIQVADVGALPPNLAVTAVRPLADRIVATVHNGGPRPRDARVHLTIDNRPPVDAVVSLGANQSADAIFAGAPRGSSATVAVDDPSGIQVDNVRYAVLGGTGRPSVLVVTGAGDLAREAFYVQHALAAGTPADAAFQVASVGGAQLAGWSDDRLAAHAAVLL